MKLNSFRLLSITCLLLIGSISYAADATPGRNLKNNAKGNVDDTSEGDAQGRSIGNVFANQYKANQTDPDKKRIRDLEDLVSQQQKLIEMYKKQSNH